MKNFRQKSSEPLAKDLQLTIPSVAEYMVPVSKLITFHTNTPVSQVIDTLLKNRITGAPVLNDEGDVVGLIDDKDCLNTLVGSAYYNHPVERDVVSEYMSNVMSSISVDANLIDVANTFLTTPYKRLLVKDKNGKLAGQISRRDVLLAIKDMNRNTW